MKYDMASLATQARPAILAEQKTDYKFIRSKFGLGTGTAYALLQRLRKEENPAIGQKLDGEWIVLLNSDGSSKNIDPATLFSRKRRIKHRKTKKKARSRKAAQSLAPKTLNGTSGFSHEEKLATLKKLAAVVPPGSPGHAKLQEIIQDYARVPSALQLLKAVE